MPQTLSFPFFAVKMRLPNGETLLMPINDGNAFSLETNVHALGERYAGRFQSQLLDQGKFTSVLDLLQEGEFQQHTLSVEFPAAKDGFSYPAFELQFEYFSKRREKGVWALLPALGLEAMSETEDALPERLREAVRIEFTAKKRLQAVQEILTANWLEAAGVERGELSLDFRSPAELKELSKEKKREFLPKVAEKLEVTQAEAFGMEEELSYMERILKSRFLRNILLVGASGTGKTALVWELAHRKKQLGIEGDIWETTASLLIKELTQDTGWQDNLSFLVKEFAGHGDVLFIRNLAELFEVGRYEGNDVSMAEYLRSFISRGEITLISECTPEERARIEVRSPNYLSFFQVIQVTEPQGKLLEDVISKKINRLAGQSSSRMEPEAVREIVRLHRRFSPYSGMPGKPIRFLESILLGLEKKKTAVDRAAVLKHYCEESGMQPFMVDPDLPMDVQAIKTRFNANVFGQERAVDAVVDLLAAVKTALTRTGKPIASFLFVGPTGVGKTELAKVLAEFMFGSRDRLLRFDMSEYSDEWSVMRLIGQSHSSDGLLTAAVRREPFCVLLFDEIEKADATFFDLLLQILSEGRLSDSRGKLVNFCSAIIIMTSNIGAERVQRGSISFRRDVDPVAMSDLFLREVENAFRPELFNRIDSVVAFDALTADTVRFVVERELDLLKRREGIRFRHLDLPIGEPVADFLAKKGFDVRYGARYLQRAIREQLIAPLAQALNAYGFDERLSVQVVLENDRLQISCVRDPLSDDLLLEQWDKMTWAEQAGELRRRTSGMLEGDLYLHFITEFDQLEAEKKHLGEAFWKNPARAHQYAHWLAAKEKTEVFYRQIQDLELEIALASIGLESFRTDFGERLIAWELAFFQHQILLIGLIHPANNACFLTIYGGRFSVALPFYLRLLELKNFTVRKAKTLWFREGYVPQATADPASNESEAEEKAGSTEHANQAVASTTDPALRQEETPEALTAMNFKKPAAGALLVGIELEVTGNCAWLFLLEEDGVQMWEQPPDDPIYLSLYLSLPKPQTPADVHRLSFYKAEKPRREVTPLKLFDKKMNISLPFLPDDLPAFFLQKMEERFQEVVRKAFNK